MRIFFLALCLLVTGHSFAQNDSTQWLRAFPITDYMVDLNDSVKVVQLQMPDGYSLKEKQLGVIYGVFGTSREEAVQKGYGRCHLIKGDYYYFTIGNNTSGQSLKAGDLLYTFMEKTGIYYGNFPRLAAHFIRLQDVNGNPFYDRYTIFFNWSEADEHKMTDSLVADIRFTGTWFKENQPSADRPITQGRYQGQKTLDVMAECTPEDVRHFLSFVLTSPRLYAGREWKITEIFATWLINGAPGA